VDPWKLSDRFYLFVFHYVCSVYEGVCKDLISDSDSVGMISAVITSTVATIPGLQQYASDGLRTQHHGRRINRKTMASMDK
jgi:hypothetical protein